MQDRLRSRRAVLVLLAFKDLWLKVYNLRQRGNVKNLIHIVFCFYFFIFICIIYLLFFYFILLYNTVLVLPYIDMNPPRVYMFSQTWSPVPPPSPQHPCAPAPSMLYPASDIDWRFDSYMIVYMFQCHCPKSSHLLPLPLSPKVRYTQLSFFLSCIQGRHCHLPNSIYMC